MDSDPAETAEDIGEPARRAGPGPAPPDGPAHPKPSALRSVQATPPRSPRREWGERDCPSDRRRAPDHPAALSRPGP